MSHICILEFFLRQKICKNAERNLIWGVVDHSSNSFYLNHCSNFCFWDGDADFNYDDDDDGNNRYMIYDNDDDKNWYDDDDDELVATLYDWL